MPRPCLPKHRMMWVQRLNHQSPSIHHLSQSPIKITLMQWGLVLDILGLSVMCLDLLVTLASMWSLSQVRSHVLPAMPSASQK